MDLFKDLTILSLEQATVLPYLTYRLAHDGINVIRLEHPVYGDPNRFIGQNILDEDRMNRSIGFLRSCSIRLEEGRIMSGLVYCIQSTYVKR